MEKNIEITLLYDIYGKLLTARQQETFEEYYLYNLSLREIAENKKISYQAVRDSLKASDNMLHHFENIVGMYQLLHRVDQVQKLCENTMDLNTKRKQIQELLKQSEDDI